MENSIVTFEVNQNAIWGDFRVDKYLNGIWVNQRDNNWSKEKAEDVAKKYREISPRFKTMDDNF
jgi:hypothetical protein